MSLTNLKLTRQEVGISELFPITHINSPEEFETETGAVGSTIELKGVPFDTMPDDRLNTLGEKLHRALQAIDETMVAYVTTHRKKITFKLDGDFPSEFSRRVNEKYHKRFKGKNVYQNRIYLTILVRGNESNKSAVVLNWAKRFVGKNVVEAKELIRSKRSRDLSTVIKLLNAQLSDFQPHVLGEFDGKSQLLAFLSLVVNGGEPISFRADAKFQPRAKSIQDTLKSETAYPQGKLGHYVSSKRILFGEYIQFQGAAKTDVRYAMMLSLKKYPTSTTCDSLEPLNRLDCEYIATHTFAPVERQVGLKRIEQTINKHEDTDDKGLSQLDDLASLEDDVSCEKAKLGFYANSLMLLSDKPERLEEDLIEAEKAYSHCGMTLVRETIGTDCAFWAQIPGNYKYVNRACLISSRNFADFCSMHNYSVGHNGENHLGKPVTLAETPSRTPACVNFHLPGSESNPSNGTLLKVAQTGAGKTTLLNTMICQSRRFNSKVFYLDRDMSSRTFCLAEEGAYTVISPDNKNNVALNPFQLPDTEGNRMFLVEWFATILLREGESRIADSEVEMLKEAVDYAFDVLDKPSRKLSNIIKILPYGFPRKSELKKWIHSEVGQSDGSYAWIFDNTDDLLSLERNVIGFDITYLLDKCPVHIANPVFMYILHLITESLDGSRLTSIVIDEFRQVLGAPYWEKAINELVPTMRKKNAHFVFSTQTPESILNSKVSAEVINNLATLVVFPNDKATKEVYCGALNLNEAEFDFVKETPAASRLVLYKQGNDSMIIKFDLSDLSEEIRVLSGNTKSALMLDEIISLKGNNPKDWLPVFIERSATA